MKKMITFAFTQCGYEMDEILGNENIHSKTYDNGNKTTYYDGDIELFSIVKTTNEAHSFEIKIANKKSKNESIETKFKEKRLEIINIILDYEKTEKIDPTTFYCMWTKTYHIYNDTLKDGGWEFSYDATKAQHPTWRATYIRFYHGVENHIYFYIKYSKKEGRYKLHYSYYIDGKEIRK